MNERLLRASRRWAAETPTVTILVADPADESLVPADTQPLLSAWRALGLRVVLMPWQGAVPPVTLALPLGTWDYCDRYDEFIDRMRQLREGGTAPTADLEAVLWHSHKRYLCELADAGIPTVPTRVLNHSDDAVKLTAALMELGAPAVYVVKPAMGSRGDGVERQVASEPADWILAMLRTRELLIQPFLSDVATCGEVCVVFVNGDLLHAVLKDPAGWGNTDATADETEPPTPALPAAQAPAELAQHASTRQEVRLLQPPPREMVELARRAMQFVTRRCGGAPYLARVDMLPASDGRWLVSELELGWPELFLRANPGAVPLVASELLRHLPPNMLRHLPPDVRHPSPDATRAWHDDVDSPGSSRAAKRARRDATLTSDQVAVGQRLSEQKRRGRGLSSET